MSQVSNLAAYRQKTEAELRYIQRDANEAAQAMKGWNPQAEAKYLDQVNDASTVLYQRKLAALKKMKVVVA